MVCKHPRVTPPDEAERRDEGKEPHVFLNFFGSLIGLVQAAGIIVFITYFGILQNSEGGWLILSGIITLTMVSLPLYRFWRVMRWSKRVMEGRWW